MKIRSEHIVGLPLLMVFALPVYGLDRLEVINTAFTYRDVSYEITSDNLYPNASVPCYSAGEYLRNRNHQDSPNSRLTLPGSNTGALYSFGQWHTALEIPAKLSEGKGAGCYDDLWGTKEQCVKQYVTGIDCSKFVGRCWGYEAKSGDEAIWLISTYSLNNNSAPFAKQLNDLSDLNNGDAVNKPGEHALLFGGWINPEVHTLAGMIHASGEYDKVVEETVDVFDLIDDQEYFAIVGKRVLNDSATNLISFSANIDEFGATHLFWETMSETNTRSFMLYKSHNKEGPFFPATGEVMAKGGVGMGAKYGISLRAIDSGNVYRLREVETTGRSYWLAIARAVPTKSQEELLELRRLAADWE